MRATKPPPGLFQLPGQTATSHAVRLVPHRPPPALPPSPEGAAPGTTLAGDGRRGGVLGEKLLVAAKKHRKPPPLPPHILEQQQHRSAAAAAAAASYSGVPCCSSAATTYSSAASGSGAAAAASASSACAAFTPSVFGKTPSGTPLTMPVHRRPPPLPTGGAVSAALHSRQHARGAAGGAATLPAATPAAAREAGGGLAAVQALKLRGPTDAHSGGWDEAEVGVEEELLTLPPQYGARAPQAHNLPAAAWAGRHSANRCDSRTGSPTNSSVHSSECAAPP